MTPEIHKQIVEVLKREPLPLTRVHAIAQEAGSPWSEHQLSLFLECMDGVEVEPDKENNLTVRIGQRTKEEALIAAIVEVVRARAGQPIPAAAIRKHLPGRFMTTDEQVKALARKVPGLEVFGPGLIRMKD